MNVKSRDGKRKLWLILGGVFMAMLVAAVITLGSFNAPLRFDEEGNAALALFAATIFIVAALFVFGLILLRTLVRLWAERRSDQIGSRFKVKMVWGAMGVSLLPLVFLFLFSYALVNRTLNAWFPHPLEIANEQSRALIDEFTTRRSVRVAQQAETACQLIQQRVPLTEALRRAAPEADALWLMKPDQSVGTIASKPDPLLGAVVQPMLTKTLATGAEIWVAQNSTYMGARARCMNGWLVIARAVPRDYLDRFNDIESQTQTYLQQKQDLRKYKREILAALGLITLLLIFTTTWVALFLSKQVTVPIQALAEATHEISRGNFDHRIHVQAQDELGTLVRSFNRMTEQLGEGRLQINEFTRNLEQAIEEREQRRKLMEAILENIPTGVVSLHPSGDVGRVNSAVISILGEHAREARTLTDLVGEDASRAVLYLMRRSLRMGAASREIEIATGGRLVRAAVTVSSLGPRRSNPGFVVVIDDLTDLLQAQKAAAWQEVAQRIAHEIKNPLTPIQLSAQRLLRYLGRAVTSRSSLPLNEFEKLVAECAGLIEREVQALESLVNEFSQFARFPAARPVQADLNSIVESALSLFHERLEGISWNTQFALSLPPVKADPELMRQVVANLIDNAAEAMEGMPIRELSIATRADSDGEAVEIEISDTGHGISPADKEKLFLPHFSTKKRGTGLGLAIASRIIAEHNGTIRVEDNLPTGARFVLRFPAEVAVPTQAAS